jgi:glycosyltransferase involved in cell wall biosynthesis
MTEMRMGYSTEDDFVGAAAGADQVALRSCRAAAAPPDVVDRAAQALRPLRILTIAACPLPARRGTPVRVERLAEALVARGHEVTVATYHIGEPAAATAYTLLRIARETRPGDLPPGPTLAKLAAYDPQLFMTVRRSLAQRNFDIVHAHHFEGLIIGALARPRGMPLVYDAHTMLESELPAYLQPPWRPLVERLARPFDGTLPWLADHVVCAGVGIRDSLLERHRYPENRVTLAGNGVELDHFAAAARVRAAAPAEASTARLLYTGTLAAYQDIDLLLEALAELRRRRPEARLVLATQSPLDVVAPLAERLGLHDAIDVVPDDFATLPEELARASVAVLPRLRCDGVPQKLLNYMAAGCPVVAFEGSAQLLRNETTGLIVANGDVPGFAAAIARLLDDPAMATTLGRQAHDFIARERSWEATALTVERVYRRLLAGQTVTSLPSAA